MTRLLSYPFLIILLTILLSACSSAPDLTELCSPKAGFESGHGGEPASSMCEQDNYLNAYRLGALLHEKQSEKIGLELQIEQLVAAEGSNQSNYEQTLRELRSRLVVIERDLPDLTTLAQLEGWLPVSAVPDQAGFIE